MVTCRVLLIAVLAACGGARELVARHVEDRSLAPTTRAAATAQGRYEGLVGAFDVPGDRSRYGLIYDDGYWGGGRYHGVSGLPAGYWVYVAPTWYVWRRTAPGVTPSAYAPPEEPAAP